MLRISRAAPVAKKDNLAAIPNGAHGHVHQAGKRLAQGQLSVGEHCRMLMEFEIEEFKTCHAFPFMCCLLLRFSGCGRTVRFFEYAVTPERRSILSKVLLTAVDMHERHRCSEDVVNQGPVACIIKLAEPVENDETPCWRQKIG